MSSSTRRVEVYDTANYKPRSREEHKKELLRVIADILDMNDDLADHRMDLDGPDYERWDKARKELVTEFERRGRS